MLASLVNDGGKAGRGFDDTVSDWQVSTFETNDPSSAHAP
jgi:hypothetical protein